MPSADNCYRLRMYGEGQKLLEGGMSRGARILLGAFAALFGAGMLAMASSSSAPIGFVAFGLFCLAIAVACAFTGRLRRAAGRLIGLAIFAASTGFLVHEALFGSRLVSDARAQPSLWNAALFFFAAGLPALRYALLGRFRWRSQPDQPASSDPEKAR